METCLINFTSPQLSLSKYPLKYNREYDNDTLTHFFDSFLIHHFYHLLIITSHHITSLQKIKIDNLKMIRLIG